MILLSMVKNVMFFFFPVTPKNFFLSLPLPIEPDFWQCYYFSTNTWAGCDDEDAYDAFIAAQECPNSRNRECEGVIDAQCFDMLHHNAVNSTHCDIPPPQPVS